MHKSLALNDFISSANRDKVAFITGGGSGIGFRVAELFMRYDNFVPRPPYLLALLFPILQLPSFAV